jgi:hypothetical protein
MITDSCGAEVRRLARALSRHEPKLDAFFEEWGDTQYGRAVRDAWQDEKKHQGAHAARKAITSAIGFAFRVRTGARTTRGTGSSRNLALEPDSELFTPNLFWADDED